MTVVRFELFPGHSLSLALVEGVSNAAALRAEVLQQKFEASFIDASMVVDLFHLQAAAIKALYALSKNALTTHGIHTELIFCLLGGRSISTALSSFGISNQSKSLVVAIFDAQPDAMAQVISHIQGTSVPVSRLGEHADAEAIKKVYKISGDELKTVRVRIPRAPSVLCTHTGNHLECILLKSDAPSAQGSLSDCAVCRIAVRDSL